MIENKKIHVDTAFMFSSLDKKLLFVVAVFSITESKALAETDIMTTSAKMQSCKKTVQSTAMK